MDAETYYNRGLVYQGKGQYDKAISDYNKAIAINPRDPEAYNNRGVAYKNKGKYSKAISDYNKAIKINPGFVEAYNNRGVAYKDKGKHDNAISDYSKAIEINPGLAGAYNNRAVAYFSNNEYEKARDDVHKARNLGYQVDKKLLEDLRKTSGKASGRVDREVHEPPGKEIGRIDRDVHEPPGKENGRIDRFLEYTDDVVKDTSTGLEWIAGPDRDTTWQEAKSWVENLTVDGGGWRMATPTELETLYQEGVGTHNMTPLLKTTGWGLWSGETKGSSSTWFFNLRFGNVLWHSHSYSYRMRAFAVRTRR